MTTKREYIENKFDELEQFYISEKLPMCEKLTEFRKNYTLEQLIGMMLRFLQPAEDCLKEYIMLEYTKLKIMLSLDKNFSEVNLDVDEKHIDTLVLYVADILKALQK